MSNADIGHGALFGIEGPTPGVYVTVAEVVAITPPGMTRDSVEVTHLTSPGKWKEFIAGLKDSGEASFTMNFAPSATDAVFAAFNADDGKYQITFPNGVMLRFGGFFTGYTPPELGGGEPMQASASIKASGPVTMHAVGN